MIGKVVFRKAVKADLPSIIALHEADEMGGHGDAWTSENQPAYEAAFTALLSDPREHVFVAEEQGRVIGSMIATVLVEITGRGKPHVLFRSIQVAGSHRSLGIGAAMMAYVEEQSRHWGASVAELTSSSKRKDAHRFYDRLGYAQSHLGFKKKL
jgi:GNAT superfamily N-acetyltransferase